jgi:NAD(P)H dehydrogenase (quinone)
MLRLSHRLWRRDLNEMASGKPGAVHQAAMKVAYIDLPENDYRAGLETAGLPSELADLLADADANAGKGALFDDCQALSRLIGRPTTPVPQTIAAALQG